MRDRTVRRSQLGLFAVLCSLALVAALYALACPAQAGAVVRIAHSTDASGTVTDYFTYEEVEKKGPKADLVVMDADWHLDRAMTVVGDAKLAIDMNGHKIDCQYTCFDLLDKSELVLTSSSDPVRFSYMGYNPETGAAMDVRTTTGGLITTLSEDAGGAFAVGSNASLTLDGVAASGSYGSGAAGGVNLDKDSSLTLKNGAKVEYNRGSSAGGVYCSESGATINLDNASISYNYCSYYGGGINDKYGNTTIAMTNGSKIDGNSAQAGGGIYFNGSQFNVVSPDGSGSVSGNKATGSSRTSTKSKQSGGGIHVNSIGGKNDGLIENIAINGNYSAYDGGGIELDQEWTTVRDCTITGNWCKYEGGGIYVCNDRNTIDNCTITGNACSVDSGGNYEGGGVFVWHTYDIKMTGKCIVKGNTRGKGTDNADDVMLREDWWTSTKAYITGSLSEGSSVGVRTGTTGDRRVAKNFKPASKDCLFYDLGDYYISYGSDEGGDAWQRHTTKEFTAKINGEAFGTYRNGTSVALVAPLTKGDSQVFWYWDGKYTSGLYPVSAYITNDNMYANALSFKMPQNDVDACAVYATRATKVIVGIKAPTAGESLPAAAEVYRADGIGSTIPFYAPVTWYEVDDNGNKTLASGTAKAGTSYAASFSCEQSAQGGLCFSKSISASSVTVKTTSGAAPAVVSAKVDGSTGALAVELATFDKTAGKAPSTAAKSVNVELQNGGLEAAVGTASSSSSISLADDGEPATQASRPVIGQFDVSYSGDSATVAVSAPAVVGYNFCNWENVDDEWISDDVDEVVVVPAEDLDKIDKLVAVYTPVVTEVEVGMEAPTVGSDLAQAVTSLKLTGYDGSTIDLVAAIGKGPLPISWSPEGEDGKADYSTAYSAIVSLVSGEGFEGVDKVLAQGAVVKTSDGTTAASAGFAIVGDDLSLCLAFPETDAVKATSISQPADVELTFERAAACQENQEAHPDENCWSLPKTVAVTLQNGETVDGDITWDIPSGFDAKATTSQEIAVKGKVRIAYTDKVDASDVSLDVSTTIKIAAPSQGGGEDGGDTPAVNPDDGRGQPENGDATGTSANADKSALAKTGDSIPVFAVAAVVVVAIAAIAVAIVAVRRNRRQ